MTERPEAIKRRFIYLPQEQKKPAWPNIKVERQMTDRLEKRKL